MVRKGQVQVLSAVLLTGIMISLVAVAYFWGLPVIQKQKDISKLEKVENLMKRLNTVIKEVANGGGRRKISTHVPGQLKFEGGAIDNVTLTFESEGSLMATNETIYLVGSKRRGMEAPVTAEGGLITARSEPTDGKYNIRFKLFYRNLTSGEKTYKVNINNVGRSSVGNRDVTITVEKSTTIKNANFYKTVVNVRFQ